MGVAHEPSIEKVGGKEQRVQEKPEVPLEVRLYKIARNLELVGFWSLNLSCICLSVFFLARAFWDTRKINNGTLEVDGPISSSDLYVRCYSDWCGSYNKWIVWTAVLFAAAPPDNNFQALLRYFIIFFMVMALMDENTA
ncbi:hypothetical protein JCM16303_006005 [Sporobolomyces ruberrimus]